MEINTNDSATDSDNSEPWNTDESHEPNVSRRKNSFVWKYFRQVDESKNYECIICNGCVGQQTSNLARHLAFTHDIKNQTDSVNCGGKRGRPSKSFIWKYCSKEDEKHARCHLCNKLLYFGGGNTENIAKHLRRKHSSSIEVEKVDDGDNINVTMEAEQAAAQIMQQLSSNGNSEHSFRQESEASVRDRKERKGGSYVWNYCDKLSRHSIRCNLCNKVMSFHGTANVITHLQRKHSIIGKLDGERSADSLPEITLNEEQQQEQQEIEYEQQTPTGRVYKRKDTTASVVWRYCRRVGRDVVRCGFCKKNLSYQGTSNLQRHLHRMHGIITQGRISKDAEDMTNFNSDFIWQHCSVREGDDKIKCNLCNAVYNINDTDEVCKHLRITHGIVTKSSPPRKRKRKQSETEDDTSTSEDEHIDDFSNDDIGFDESNVKRDDSLFDDIIEEDPENTHNYDEEPFDPSTLNDLPSANPLSPHSSRGPSPAVDVKPVFDSKKMQHLNEEKVRMETEYFREKAGFYRMQKYLTALQAKKVRLEMVHLNNGTNEHLVNNIEYVANVSDPGSIIITQ